MIDQIIEWAAVFAAMFALDFIWARYTKAVGDRRPASASTWATLIILVSGFVTTSYVGNPFLLIPAGFGAFAGTYAAILFGKTDHA